MDLTLLVSLKDQEEQNAWSLKHEISQMEIDDKLALSQNESVIPVGLHAFLLDQTKAHAIYVQVCAHLIDKKWPYFVCTVDASSILVEGKCEGKLQSIVPNYLFRGLDLS
jgi:hypothetical protein